MSDNLFLRKAIPARQTFRPINLSVTCLLLGAALLLVSCQRSSAERYGFVALLGKDTVSLESITRKGNELISDEVDRFPRVRIRHTVVTLDAGGSIRHLVMDIHAPSEPAGQRFRKVVAEVANNKVLLSKTDSTGTVNRNFASDGSPVMAHVPQMYSLYELYFAAASRLASTSKLPAGSPVQLRQFYIDREFDRFPLGYATVTMLNGGKAEIAHDWLSGTGEAVMDSGYRMLSYSGNRTTYKVQVRRLGTVPEIKSIAERFEATEANNGVIKSMSVRDSVRAQIGQAALAIDYSRPLLRGRILLGDLIPYDQVWRTGADAATQFSTSAPIKLAGLQVPAGTYTLWTIPRKNGIDLIVNKEHGQWGTDYNGSQNLGMGKMTSESASVPTEAFTISMVPKDSRHGLLIMQWGSFRWTAPIEVQ